MPDPWLEAVTRGPVADTNLLQIMTGLTQNLGLTAQERLQNHEMPLPSGEESTGEQALWTAWIWGWAMLQDGRPLDALDAIQRILPAGWPQPDSAHLGDAEVAYLLAAVFSRQNAKVPAAEIAALGQAILQRFFAEYRQDPGRTGYEVLTMLAVFFGDNIIGEWTTAGITTTELPPAWTVSRGVDLLTGFARIRQDSSSSVDDIIEDLLQGTAFAVECVGTRLDDRRIAMVEMTVGDCVQASDPHWASLCYASVIRRVEPDDILALQARTNLALMASDVTADRWDDLARTAEQSFGDLAGAAQLRILGYEARWRQGTRSSMHDEILELVRAQEQMLPERASFRSLFAAKQPIETGYLLLATVNAHSDDRSIRRFDEIMSVVRALLTGSIRADLGTSESAEQDVWEAMLNSQRQPSVIIREALSTNPGVGVLHLVHGIGCVIWIAYGVVRDGEFFTRWGVMSDDARRYIDALLACVGQQLEADRISDSLTVAALNERIEHFGEKLGSLLPQDLLTALGHLDHLLYAPHPGGSLDEFPISAIRIHGAWLTDRVTLTRITTFLSLRTLLSPTFPATRPNGTAVVVLGNADWQGSKLRGVRRHAAVIDRMLTQTGFVSSIAESATQADMNRWLDGGSGVLHCAGHGAANEVLEALPLPSGESFDPLSVEDYRGYRFPFVFLCACVAARIRYGKGGHMIGLLTGLIDRGAPAGIAFMNPVGERYAYLIAEEFYRQARLLSFGRAVAQTLSVVRQQVPAYAWLALTSYGDPLFELPAMNRTLSGALPSLRRNAATWHAAVRNHCALRTDATSAAVRERLDEIPAKLRPTVKRWLAQAFTASIDVRLIRQLEEAAASATATQASDIERLTIKVAACAARLDALMASGVKARFGPATQVPHDANFLTRVGATLCDLPLNGLGLALWGLTMAQVDLLDDAWEPLWEAIDKLWTFEEESPFVMELLEQCRRTFATIDPTRAQLIFADRTRAALEDI